MIAIVLSFALGSVILGIVLGKLLKRAANAETFELSHDRKHIGVHGFEDISSLRGAPAPLIIHSNET